MLVNLEVLVVYGWDVPGGDISLAPSPLFYCTFHEPFVVMLGSSCGLRSIAISSRSKVMLEKVSFVACGFLGVVLYPTYLACAVFLRWC